LSRRSRGCVPRAPRAPDTEIAKPGDRDVAAGGELAGDRRKDSVNGARGLLAAQARLRGDLLGELGSRAMSSPQRTLTFDLWRWAEKKVRKRAAVAFATQAPDPRPLVNPLWGQG
jgi:hypothetical protein